MATTKDELKRQLLDELRKMVRFEDQWGENPDGDIISDVNAAIWYATTEIGLRKDGDIYVLDCEMLEDQILNDAMARGDRKTDWLDDDLGWHERGIPVDYFVSAALKQLFDD